MTWRHPEQGLSAVYRPGGCGFDATCELGTEHLAMLADLARENARIDFAHDEAHFARDLRISPVRDTTDSETYAALRAVFIRDSDPLPPGWREVG